MKELCETEKAYIAGIIDGEGSLTLSKQSTGRGYYCRVSVVNTNKDLINYLHRTTDIGSMGKHSKPHKRTHRQQWKWVVVTKQAATLIEELMPFLIIKKESGKLLLEFQQMKSLNNRFRPLSNSQISKELRIFEEIRQLNLGWRKLVKATE